MRLSCAAVLLALFSCASLQGQARDLNTALMESTFKVQGVSARDPHSLTFGTAFFLGRPSKGDPSRSYFILITAGHVLDGIAGDEAVIFLRQKQADERFRKFPYTFKIREGGRNLYVHHPQADVAAMYFNMPVADPFTLIDDDFLADDSRLVKWEIHPGDELLCLGYPLGGEANEAGFPILRSGKIASYPLVPTAAVKSFLYDFRVFEGNSGGPVYLSYDTRWFGGALHAGAFQSIVGLVTEQAYAALPNYRGQALDIGVVVPAVFIIEAIRLLPDRA